MPAYYNLKEITMRNLVIKAAVLSALSIASTQVLAAPNFVVLTGSGTSAYTECNNTGDFGSGNSVEPRDPSSNRTCATFPNNGTTDAAKNPAVGTAVATAYGSISTTPVVGFSLAASTTRSIVMNNTATGGVDKAMGTLIDLVWKDSAGTSCIYGVRVSLSNTPISGTNYWEANDIARAGFANFTVGGSSLTAAGALSIAYWRTFITDEVTFRAGRTYSAVQHHFATGGFLPAGAALPPVSPVPSAAPQRAIVGVASTTGTVSPWLGYSASTTQAAPVDNNWVDFTTDVNFKDPDGSTYPDSSMNYIRVNKTAGGASGCPATSPTGAYLSTANAIRIRSTGQENQSLIEVAVSGYAPSGASAANP